MAGREIRYVGLPAHTFATRLTELGMFTSFAEDVAALLTEVATGSLAPTTTAVADLTGRPPQTFDDFVRDNADTIRTAWSA